MGPRGGLGLVLKGSRVDQLRLGAHTRGRKMAAKGRPEVTQGHFLQDSCPLQAARGTSGFGRRPYLWERPQRGRRARSCAVRVKSAQSPLGPDPEVLYRPKKGPVHVSWRRWRCPACAHHSSSPTLVGGVGWRIVEFPSRPE
uniref:Uncharacterized protein n=1 Tax=Theropithecus gelada TaxID=9565 RepID=A0A8D2K5H6_THEGE